MVVIKGPDANAGLNPNRFKIKGVIVPTNEEKITTPKRAIEKLESVLTWIQSLRLENNRYYTANYDAKTHQFNCREDEKQNNAHEE